MTLSRRHPDWLKVPFATGEKYKELKSILKKNNLNTICEEANCPNQGECFSNKTASFLILGKNCTRNCRYCDVNSGLPEKINENEPRGVAEAVNILNLKSVVITSVTRDDLPDFGAGHFAETVKEIKKKNQHCHVEVLISDLQGDENALKKIIDSQPDVISHNIEAAKDVFEIVRPKGDYSLSLNLIQKIKQFSGIKIKSGIMVGFGETKKDIISTIADLRNVGTDFLTIGQYLQASNKKIKVSKYYSPDEFSVLKKVALDMGFLHVESAPLVRSSYHAERLAKYS